MKKIKLVSPSVDEILAPYRHVIREEGSAVIQDALDRRAIKIQQFARIVREDLEEEKERELELQKMMMSLDQLQKANALKEAHVAALQVELEQIKLMPELRKQQKQLNKLTQLKDKTLTRLENLQNETRMYEEFQKHAGLLYLGHQIEQNQILLASTKIHPKYPEDQYLLYFSKFDLTGDSGLSFTVHYAEPTFSQFDEVASKYNESQEFKKLIDEVQEHWKRDACKEGQPRLATPIVLKPSVPSRPVISTTPTSTIAAAT